MADISRVDHEILDPAVLKLGTTDASEIREIICGQATVDLPSINTVAIASASAAVAGLTANHRVLLMPAVAAVTDAPSIIVAAVGIAGGLQVTGYNTQSAAIDATARSFNFLAFRTR